MTYSPVAGFPFADLILARSNSTPNDNLQAGDHNDFADLITLLKLELVNFETFALGGVLAALITPTAVKTANYTAVAGNFVPCDTTSGAFTVTLPTAPADKTVVAVKLVTQGASNAVTIARGGSDVFNKSGGSTSLTVALLNEAVLLQYKSSSAIWYVVATDTPPTAQLHDLIGPSDAYVAASVTGATTVDNAAARVHKLTMTGNITLTLSGAVSGRACGLTLYLVQDGTGSRLVTWPASVKWPGAAAPTLSTAASSIDIVVLETFDGGTTWFANLAGKAYA